MIRKALLFIVLASLATVAGAREANVFASGLKATHVEGNKYNFTYTLNAPAKNVVINFYSGDELVKSIQCRGLAKGENNVILNLTDLDGEYSWSVKAAGEPWQKGENATVVVDKSTNPLLSFMSPRGIDMDKDTESEFYGRVYVTETRSAEVDGRTTNVGIYVFDAALNDVTGQGDVAYGGNVEWGRSSGCTRIFLNKDQKIYLSDWSDGHPGVWRADATNLNADFVPVFGGYPDPYGLRFNDDNIAIAGSIPSCWVEGTGEKTVLYTFDEDYINDNGNTQGVYQFNIGNLEQPWTDAPSAVIYDNAANTHQNGNSVIIPQNGGWWISQTRWEDAADVPSLVYVKNNEVLFNSGAVNPDLISRSYSSAICLFDEGTKMAVSCYDNIKIFEVSFNDAGVPTLTELMNIEHSLGHSCYSIAIDAAHNMYCAVDRNGPDTSGNVGVIALPLLVNECETPAPLAQMIVVEGGLTVPGDVNGDGVVTAADITALYSAMLNNDYSEVVNGDQNGDGLITAADITAVYTVLLNT